MLWPLAIGAAYSPSSMKVVRRMLNIAEVGDEDVVYDLGSGDGRIVIEAAQKYHAWGVGVEADPLRVFWSRLKIRNMGLQDHVKIIWGNLFHQNIHHATVIILFLWGKTNENLKEKLQEELEPGTRIVSYVWKFKGWKPVKVDKKERIYLYIIGESNKTKHDSDETNPQLIAEYGE
ncbi:SAM-dependent methyltransferase [Methanobacterium petrolearium]|uniref:SAM-dependent methyltransferase n=2 Tax=Methanobacterium petrolearium TaxID=710190 RepID=UPI001FD7B391|nr:SAM-dependent methyltransferase [Methanobacterium petrolearium]